MFRRRQEIELKPQQPERQQQQREDPKSEIVVSLGITLIDKYNVLDDYYSWLFKNSYDANQAVVLNEYKKHLRERERL